MSRQQEPLEIQGSEVQGSGRFFFALAKTVVDLIDDELTVSDSHKCAGTKVDMGKRWLRVGAGAVHKVSKNCTTSCPSCVFSPICFG